MMSKNILMLFLGIFFLQACVEDNGNYSYSELDKIEIDTSNVQTSYRITQLDYLQVNPGVKQGVSDENLSFQWRIFQDGNQPNPVTGKIVDEIVGHERFLNYKMVIPPGEYKLGFTVTDRKNGVGETFWRKLYVESFASVGMMIIHGDADSSDVSILVNERIVPESRKDDVKHNIFSLTNGHQAIGAPAGVYYVPATHNVYVYTHGKHGGYRTGGSDLSVLEPYSQMFTENLVESEVDFQAYDRWSYNDLLINNGKLYYNPQPSTTFNRFGVPCFGVEYYAMPFIATQMYGVYYGVIYDKLARRFIYINYNRQLILFKEPTGAAAAFNMNQVGKEMLYAEHGFEKKWYCVMKDPVNPADYSIYVCDLSKTDDGNRGVGKYDASACTEIGDAKAFAVGNRGEILYYATATEVKQCDYKQGGKSIPRYSLPESLVGYEITMLKMFKVSGHANEGKILYVGVYNALTGDGKLLECPIVETTGEVLTADIKVYKGFKKIIQMDYKSK